MTMLLALAGAWAALLLLAPWLPVPIAGVVYLLGGRLCHQIAERSFHVGGDQLPVCARCIGIYVGGALAWSPHGGQVPRGGPAVLAALALNALTLGIEWTDVWPVSNTIRAGAGAALGVAVALAVREALRVPGRLKPVQ